MLSTVIGMRLNDYMSSSTRDHRYPRESEESKPITHPDRKLTLPKDNSSYAYVVFRSYVNKSRRHQWDRAERMLVEVDDDEIEKHVASCNKSGRDVETVLDTLASNQRKHITQLYNHLNHLEPSTRYEWRLAAIWLEKPDLTVSNVPSMMTAILHREKLDREEREERREERKERRRQEKQSRRERSSSSRHTSSDKSHYHREQQQQHSETQQTSSTQPAAVHYNSSYAAQGDYPMSYEETYSGSDQSGSYYIAAPGDNNTEYTEHYASAPRSHRSNNAEWSSVYLDPRGPTGSAESLTSASSSSASSSHSSSSSSSSPRVVALRGILRKNRDDADNCVAIRSDSGSSDEGLSSSLSLTKECSEQLVTARNMTPHPLAFTWTETAPHVIEESKQGYHSESFSSSRTKIRFSDQASCGNLWKTKERRRKSRKSDEPVTEAVEVVEQAPPASSPVPVYQQLVLQEVPRAEACERNLADEYATPPPSKSSRGSDLMLDNKYVSYV